MGVREKLMDANREIAAAINQLRDPGFIPQPALDLLEKAKKCTNKVAEFRDFVEEIALPILRTHRGRYGCGNHSEKFVIDLITLTAMGARLQRYIFGLGGPVPRGIAAATMAVVSVELSKENMCSKTHGVRYPKDNTVNYAFSSYALLLYTLYGYVQNHRGCYRG